LDSGTTQSSELLNILLVGVLLNIGEDSFIYSTFLQFLISSLLLMVYFPMLFGLNLSCAYSHGLQTDVSEYSSESLVLGSQLLDISLQLANLGGGVALDVLGGDFQS
jgi:hypothetical protein